jgi:hypothetical protein
MENDQALEDTYGTEDATLRLALAEAEMEISLLKIELQRTRQKLEQAEEILRSRGAPPHFDTTVDALRESQVVERVRRTGAPPSVRPRDTIFSTADLPALPRQRSALPKIESGNGR